MLLKDTVLIIDAGHGGINPEGKYTTYPAKCTKHANGFHKDGWFYEGVSNRQIAAEFIKQATARGFVCIPVYHPYFDTPLSIRTELANNIAADMQAQSVFLSFHSNAMSMSHEPQDKARGVTVWHHPYSSKGKEIATATGERIQPIFEEHGSQRSSLIHTAEFWVLDKTIMPAVLFELGFFDHTDDAELLVNPFFITEIITNLVHELHKMLD